MACDVTANYRLMFPWEDYTAVPVINEQPFTDPPTNSIPNIRSFSGWVQILQLGSNTALCDYMVDNPSWFIQTPAPGIVTSWTGQQGATRTGAVTAMDRDYRSDMIEGIGPVPGADVAEQLQYLFNNSGGTDDHLVLASTADTVPGALYDKLDIVGMTKAIVNGGGNELLRFSGTPSGGGTGAFPLLEYADVSGGQPIPKSGAWTDIFFDTAVLTTTAVTTADGVVFDINESGNYFIYGKGTLVDDFGRVKQQIRVVVDTGAGYGPLSGSGASLYTPSDLNDEVTVQTGLTVLTAAAGDKVKMQMRCDQGVLDGQTSGENTSLLIFKFAAVDAFIELSDVPASYAGAAGQMVVVKATEDGLEFVPTTGGGTVTSVSVVAANGFDGSVATPGTTPAITIKTSQTGLLSGDGTAIAGITTSAGVAAQLSDETGSGALVFADQPQLSGIALAAGTTTVAPIYLTAGTNLTTPVGGTIEYDGTNFYLTV